LREWLQFNNKLRMKETAFGGTIIGVL